MRTIDSTLINFYIKNKKNFISFVKEIKPGAIITTVGSFSTVFFGLLVRKLSKDIKWILDFRDPMALYTNYKRPAIKRWVDIRIEKRIIKKPDLCFITSKTYSEGMWRFYGVRIPVVYNGYSKEKKIEVDSSNYNTKIILEKTALGKVGLDSDSLIHFFSNLYHYQKGTVKKVEEFSRENQALQVKSLLEGLWN